MANELRVIPLGGVPVGAHRGGYAAGALKVRVGGIQP
jgi:hypothetical protein